LKKIKVLTISDHPFSPSGVATQTKYVIEGLLKTGKFDVLSLAGAIKHNDYTPQKVEGYGDHWKIHPVDGYGNEEQVRNFLRGYKPDMIWFMTDPRFYPWLWTMADEIRPLCPLIYYHVWDNYPYPTFNKKWYDSTDVIASISKLTQDIVETVAPDVESVYLPHAVNPDIFNKHNEVDMNQFKEENFKSSIGDDRFMFFWNNRNARRKQSGSLIYWFKEFLDDVGHDKAFLVMHTDIKDPNGQDLEAIVHELGLLDGQIMFSQKKMPPQGLSLLYNAADCTVNISDAEGFGLATLESLSCETPIIATMTGGLQEQVTDGENWFGVGIEPASKSIIGSQEVPWIYEDRLDKKDVIAAFHKMYSMSKKDREKMGSMGRQHVIKNYNFDDFQQKWIDLLEDIHKRHGSWSTRKLYKSWELIKIV